MSLWRLVLRGLTHKWPSHLALVTGVAVATSIVVGALGIGDSLRASLESLVEHRLGKADLALMTGDYFVSSTLADRLDADHGLTGAPLLLLEGIVMAADGGARLDRVQVVGADHRFWQLGPGADPLSEAPPHSVAANRTLADQLGLTPGEELIVRLEAPNTLPGELSFSSRFDSNRSRRFEVATVVADDQLGRFSLRSNQVSPATLFVDLTELSRWLGIQDRSNLILFAEPPEDSTKHTILDAVRSTWRLEDLGLHLRTLPNEDSSQLESQRVFLHPEIVRAVFEAAPHARAVSTYLVNTVSNGDVDSPYAFVAAPGSPLVGRSMTDDEIIINRWLAEDLQAAVGDTLDIAYFVPDSGARLVERHSTLRIREVVAIEGPAADQSLMPSIPGMAGAEDCREWDPGIPIDLERIRERDEQYWDLYRGTPKAFVTQAAARNLWSNRYGELTAIRLQSSASPGDQLTRQILSTIDPARLGFAVSQLRENGLRAAREGVDFAQLFLGLSFFIITAALLLVALLFRLDLLTKGPLIGALRALGWPDNLIRRWLLAEGATLALVGAALGVVGAVLFVHLVLFALGTVWHGAVGHTRLSAQIDPSSLAIGCIGSALAGFAVMVNACRAVFRVRVADQLGDRDAKKSRKLPRGRYASLAVAGACLSAAVLLALSVDPGSGRQATTSFWIAGALVLLASMAATRSLFIVLSRRRSTGPPTLVGAGIAAATTAPRRSLITVMLIATSVFLVVAVAANRRNPQSKAESRSSGTGGFAFYGDLTSATTENFEDAGVRQSLGVAGGTEVSIVPLRRLAGDDASCLNLNRVAAPPVLGVPVDALNQRSAFSFAALLPNIDAAAPWPALTGSLDDGAIPAFADQTVIIWGLGKGLGDEILVEDGFGRQQRLRLVGGLQSSVLQGNVLISDDNFTRLFPDQSGFEVLLVDAPHATRDGVRTALRNHFEDQGLRLDDSAHRLASFLVVENTYLNIFLALGGLGLVLGTAGVGLVTLRKVLERRSDLAALTAMGFSPCATTTMLVAEHALLVGLGLFAGTTAALVAVFPAVSSPGAVVPWGFIGLLLLLLAATGITSSVAAARFALKGSLISALRND